MKILINTTNDREKSSIAKNSLENSGISVGLISNKNSGKSNNKTIFIIDSKNKDITNILKDLPFKFTVIYRNNIEKSTLIIGDNF